MREAVIVEALRTPVGKRNGKLKNTHPVELLGHLLSSLVERTGIDPELVDDVVTGCVSQVGEQSVNAGRNAWLSAGLPESVPATTIDRQCGSSQQAAHFAAQGVIAGAYDIAIACGVESMTRVPMMSNVGEANPFGEKMVARYEGKLVPQGYGAEMIGGRWGITREMCDEIALASHQRAQAATESGAFRDEIVPIKVTLDDGSVEEFTTDEGIRPGSTMEKLGELKPAFYNPELEKVFPEINWVVTAGNSSQISDGASALLVMTPQKAEELGLTPRWRFHTFALAGTDPVTMLTGPIPASQKALAKAGLTADQIDHFEINEAFATVVGAWQKELGVGLEKVNPRGGAIALGHPLGGSGGRLMTTMLHALEDNGQRFGLQSMCEGGGLANATIIERLG
jgi:acetyl-CoA acyltransferase